MKILDSSYGILIIKITDVNLEADGSVEALC
jgi:hypothetical protein